MKKAASDESPRFHNLVSELKASGRVGTRKGGREEPEEDIWWTSDKKIYNTGQPVDAQKPRKLKADAVGVSNIRRPKR